jgi:hypothetical protein
MRLKRYYILVDSIEVHITAGTSKFWQTIQVTRDTTTTYQWISDQFKFNIVELIYKGQTPKFFSGSYLASSPNPNGLNSLKKPENLVSVFPNPASKELKVYIEHNDPSLIEIYDISGKKIISKVFERHLLLNTESLGDGIYLYKVIDKTGKIYQTGKFNVMDVN